MSQKTYVIAGKTYEQRALVLGQWRQLQALLADLQVPAGNTILHRLIAGLEEAGRLDRALAIILVEVGQSAQHKDLDALEAEIAFAITPEQIAELINDFFVCNPVNSILSRLGNALLLAMSILMTTLRETGLSAALSPSAPEISPDATISSGDSPRLNAAPGSESATAS